MSANRVVAQFSRFAMLAVAACSVLVIIGLVAAGFWILRDLENLSRREIDLAGAAIAFGSLFVGMALAWLHAHRSLLRSKADLSELLHSRAESERALAQRAEEMRERDLVANTASLRLSDAVNSLNDGFVLWDKDDRLAICNEHYRKLYPKMADLSVAGRHFEDIIRGAIARGLFPEAVGREDAFVAERIARHKSSDSTVVHQLEDGRWIRISKHHTAEGGVVSLHADITEQKSAELAARAAHEVDEIHLAAVGRDRPSCRRRRHGDQIGHGPPRARQRRPLRAHRRAGDQSRGNGRRHARADGNAEKQYRQRAEGQRARRCHAPRRRKRRRGRRRCGRGDGTDRSIVAADRRHHRHDRGDRLPDQSSGPECRGRSGAGRRCRPRLCRRRPGSTRACRCAHPKPRGKSAR